MFLLSKFVRRSGNRVIAVISKRKNSQNIRSKITSGIPDIEIPRVPLHEYVLEHASNWEDRIAAECGVTGRKYTYNELRKKARNFAGALRKKLKLEKRDVIAILVPNIPEFPIILLGALRAGLIVTAVNPVYTPAEISKQLLDSSTKAIVTLNELWALASASTRLTNRDISIISINTQPGQANPTGAINFSELVDNHSDFTESNEINPEEIAVMPYSSGTTGLPKAVQLTHLNFVSSLCQMEHPLIIWNVRTTAAHQDTTLAVLPVYHVYGITILCLFQLRLGCKIVTLPKFTPELYVNCLRKYRLGVLYTVPPIAFFLANNPDIKENDLKHVRTIVCGAAPLGALDEEKLKKKTTTDIQMFQGYGLTETTAVVLTARASHLSNKSIVGSVGQPVPNTEVKIIDTDDETATNLGPNKIGELIVKGPQVMKGYHNRPEENVFVDGYMKTGDLMYYNEEGLFYITGRLKELIKVKGFQVSPAELEEIIRHHPDIVDAAVIGIPHSTNGEAPRAYVVRRQDSKISADELTEYVKNQVAPYKQLKGGVAFIDSIPKSAAGKILRKDLKLMYEEENV